MWLLTGKIVFHYLSILGSLKPVQDDKVDKAWDLLWVHKDVDYKDLQKYLQAKW